MKVLIGQIPVVVFMLVTCTVCGASTTEPNRIMQLRGELITDGCGECRPTPATYPTYPWHLPRLPRHLPRAPRTGCPTWLPHLAARS